MDLRKNHLMVLLTVIKLVGCSKGEKAEPKEGTKEVVEAEEVSTKNTVEVNHQ